MFAATNTTITVSAPNIAFYVNPTCAGAPASSIGVLPGSPRATFYAVGNAPAMVTVAASAPGLTGDSQPLAVTDGPNALVFTTTTVPTKAATCFPLGISSRRNGVAIAPPSPVTVTLGVTTGAARYYSDPSCDVEVSSLLLATSSGSIFVRALSSPTNHLVASVPLWTSAQLDVTTTPMVRRGSCSFEAQSLDGGADGGPGPLDTFAFCTQMGFSAVAANTVIFHQTSTLGDFADSSVRCRLSGSGAGLNCNRGAGALAATISWQILEDPSRLRVGTFDGTCASSHQLTRFADLSKTFLVRAKQNPSGNYDDEDTAVFTFTDGGTVASTVAGCGTVFLQSVEWSGVSVSRGEFDGGMGAGVAEVRFQGLPPASANRALLVQHGLTFNGGLAACASMGRGAMPSPTEVLVRRALGSSTCASVPSEYIAFERIDFGNRARVQELTTPFAAGVTSVPVSITPVDPTRTVVFASGQTDFGQGSGETNDLLANRPLEAAFTFELTPPVLGMSTSTQVVVRRTRSAAAAAVTFYVLQAE